MAATATKLTQAVEAYFTGLQFIRASGGATDERSLYVPLANLLNAVGATLQPKVFCVQDLANQGVGHPDFGLYTTQQVQTGRPKSGQKPERGVIEVKPVEDDAWLTAASDQVSRYWQGYRQVLVTNNHDFVFVGEDAAGHPVRLESLRIADSAAQFNAKLEHPRAFAREVGPGLGEYLTRVLSHAASLAEPKDVAWLLASYARDGLARVEQGRRCHVARHIATGAGRFTGREVRRRTGCRLLPVHPRPDAVLRRLLRLGPLESADAGAGQSFQLARRRLPPAGSSAARTVPTDF